MKDKDYRFIITLNKYRIAILILFITSFLSLIFLLGMGIGVQSTVKNDSYSQKINSSKIISYEGNNIPSLNHFNLDEYYKKDQKNQLNKHNLSSKKNIFNYSSNYQDPKVISSALLLAKEQQSNKSQNIKISSRNNSFENKDNFNKTKTSRILKEGTKPKYYIQLVATYNEERANFILKNLKKDGYNKAFIKRTLIQGKKAYAIRVGFFDKKEQASFIQKNIEKKSPIFKNSYVYVGIPQR